MKIQSSLLQSVVTVVASVSLCAVAGCAATTPAYDSHFGNSVKVLMAQQVINPDASRNPNNPAVDGQAAHAAIERYNKSFQSPTPAPNVFMIGVGSGSGGGGGQ